MSRRNLRRRSRPTAALLAVGFLLICSGVLRADPPDRSSTMLQQEVDRLRQALGIPQSVEVALAAGNTRLVSVAPPAAPGGAFRLRIDAAFVRDLADDELAAALAHELGHVWIFTHHPFLQTERLANDIALRVVTRDSLARLYVKMAARTGLTPDLDALLGAEPVDPARLARVD